MRKERKVRLAEFEQEEASFEEEHLFKLLSIKSRIQVALSQGCSKEQEILLCLPLVAGSM